MKKIKVSEGNTGVLELEYENGHKEIFRPDCDLDKAQTILYKFYELETTSGRKIKDSFEKGGINWFPTAVSLLYWQFFYQYIKYKFLADQYLAGDISFSFKTAGRFQELIYKLDKVKRERDKVGLKRFARFVYHYGIQLRNALIVKKDGDILFYRYGPNDFRTNELSKELDEHYNVTQVSGIPLSRQIHYLFNSRVYILTANIEKQTFQPKLSDDVPATLKAALKYLTNIVNSHIATYQTHKKILKHFKYSLFLGIDDANDVYPILYAAQDIGIKTVGIQHGAYVRRHEAYIMHGIKQYRWYDNVLVWGIYWKNKVHKYSMLFQEDFHILAGNKHKYKYTNLPKKRKDRTILVPYEFLADSIQVGKYIKKFINKGYKVFFKPRVDEDLKDQLRTYYLGDLEHQVEVLIDITPEAMAEIDVIAGSSTTLLFDLLPYNKPVWILDTPLRLLYDMVEDGYARLITEEDMDRIDQIFEEEVHRCRNINGAEISGHRSMFEVVRDNFLYR